MNIVTLCSKYAIMNNTIQELEKQYWDTMASKDYETVQQLTKFPCIVAGKQGVMSVDEPGFKKMFDQNINKKMTVKSISDEHARVSEDHAMIAYLIELDYDGNVMKYACTSTWVKESGDWKCAMHTESDLAEK